ncbi:hypothetical protein ACOSQ3_033443 [Xanthoceras sorbifolium]
MWRLRRGLPTVVLVLLLQTCLLGAFSVELEELLALREGLSLAKEQNLSVVWAEVDAASVVAGISTGSFSSSFAGAVYDDIKAFYTTPLIDEDPTEETPISATKPPPIHLPSFQKFSSATGPANLLVCRPSSEHLIFKY